MADSLARAYNQTLPSVRDNPAGGGAAGLFEARLFSAAAQLMELAGDGDGAIEQQRTGTAKYIDVPGLVFEQLVQHVAGECRCGSRLVFGNDDTRLLMYDCDNPESTRVAHDAGRLLADAGAYVLWEASPSAQHRDSGRLILCFDDLVNAAAAHATALKHAPVLGLIREHFPAGRKSVALPAGPYRWDRVDAWCELYRMGTDYPGVFGIDAVELLLNSQTPAAWVTEPAQSLVQEPVSDRHELDERLVDVDDYREHRPLAAHELHWQREYREKRNTMYFWFTAVEAAAWFNSRHDVRQMVDTELNGYARAAWRGERTPSVKLYGDNSWVDFGSLGSKSNGRLDGGDALELECRRYRCSRAMVLRSAARGLISDAVGIVKRAGTTGSAVPCWVAEIMSPAGFRFYDSQRGR